jgi:hypothetical protein
VSASENAFSPEAARLARTNEKVYLYDRNAVAANVVP